MAKFFTPEEVQDILREVDRAKNVQQEARRRRETTDRVSETQRPTLGKVREVVKVAVQTRVASFLLSLLPRDVAAGISGAALLGGIVPGFGAVAGFAGGVAIEQARRIQERTDKGLRAQIKASGIAADINATFVPPENFDAVIQEGTAVRIQLEDAIKSGSKDKVLRAIQRLTTTGKAAMAASKAFTDTMADWQGVTRAKQTAFQAYYRAQGPYIPRPLFDEQRAINNRADKAFRNFHKDPPIKG